MADQTNPFADLLPEPDLGEFADLVQPTKNAATKSEKTLRDLSFVVSGPGATPDGRIDPVGFFDASAAVGSRAATMAAKGLVGIAGTVAGMVPGGESPNDKANRWMKTVPEMHYDPLTRGGETGVQLAGAVGEAGVDAAKYGASGWAGIPVLPQGGIDEATTSIKQFQNTPGEFVENPYSMTEGAWPKARGTLGAVLSILPDLASMGVPVGNVPKMSRARPGPRVENVVDMPPSGFGGVGQIDDAMRADRPGPKVPEEPGFNQFDRFTEAMRRGDRKVMLEEINANPAIVAAFRELDIPFTPGMVSESMPIRQTESALGSMVDSDIPTAHRGVQAELEESARKLIDESGGDFDAPNITAERVVAQMEEKHAQLKESESILWEDLAMRVPRGRAVDARKAAARVRREVELIGAGDIDRGLAARKGLRDHERRLFEMTHKRNPETGEWEYVQPSYAVVDRFREDLGLSMKSNQPFSGAEPGKLKQLYGEMAEIQGRVAKAEGYGDQWKQANSLTQTRKELEAAMTRLGAGTLTQSVQGKLRTATNAMLKDADTKRWDQLMADVPADMKQAVAAQALQHILFPAGKGRRMADSVRVNFEIVKNNPAIRDRLLDPLPLEARSRFMAIGEAATGFYRMMDRALSNPSGTAMTNYILEKIQKPEFLDKIFGPVIDQTSGRFYILKDVVDTAVRRTPEQKKARREKQLTKAVNMLNDPAFRRAITEYAAGRVEKANEILKNSQSYAAWLKSQPLPMKERLQTAGIVALFEEETE